jgi:hypothetical protein
MEATATNPVLEAIEKIIDAAKKGWEEQVTSMISARIQLIAPRISEKESKPLWNSDQERREYEALLQIACNLSKENPESDLFEELKHSMLELLEKNFQGSLISMPKRIRNLAFEHFPVFCSP